MKQATDEPPYSKKKVRECLRSLAFPEMDARRHGIEPADKDTCGWIFETTQFENWQSRVNIESHNGVLWIKGKPGAGKSTLMKQILGQFKGSSEELLIAAYFFHGRGNNPLQKSPLGMLRSILYQWLDQSPRLFEVFLPMFQDKQNKHGDDIPWHLGELKSFLLSSVERLGSNRILLLIDALDECMDEEVQSVVSFLEILTTSAIESGKALGVCLASRHYPQIRMKKADELIIEAHAKHDEDIIGYVRHNLTINDSEIEEEILRKANHVFLWVEIVVKMLNEAYNNGRVRVMHKVLREVPSDLNSLYSELLTKGRSSDEIRESVYVLQWVLFAQEALSPEELYFAVLAGTDPDQLAAWDREKESRSTIQRYITSTSKGLVELRTTRHGFIMPDVQFIHESVKDFLLSVKGLQSLDPSLSQNLIGSSHSSLAGCCLSYVMMKSLELLEKEAFKIRRNESLAGSYPFLQYAVKFILTHMEAAEAGKVSQLERLLKLQQGSPELRRLQNSGKVFGGEAKFWQHEAEIIHAAASRGLYEIVRITLDKMEPNVDIIGGLYGTALQTAAASGNEQLTQLCLDHGSDVNIVSGYLGTALQAAAYRGKENILQLCLSHGADVNAKGGYYHTALHAALSGRAARALDENILRRRLEHGAEVNAQGGKRGTVLHEAKEWERRQAIIDLLLRYGAEDHPPLQGYSEEETGSEGEDTLTFSDSDSD